jgi:rubrerythrin
MDILGFLKVMIIEEKGAREKYQVAVDESADPEVRAVFEKLRDEEAFHIEFLENEYDRLQKLTGR